MDISELGNLLTEYGVCIQAIPRTVTDIVEKMWVRKRTPEHAGQFLVKVCRPTMAQVDFSAPKYYDTLEDAINEIVKMDRSKKAESQASVTKIADVVPNLTLSNSTIR